jgi:hypothetical protein
MIDKQHVCLLPVPVTGTTYNYGMLSYKSTDIGAFEPRVQQKRLFTGKRKGDWPQAVRLGPALEAVQGWPLGSCDGPADIVATARSPAAAATSKLHT